MGRNRGQPMKRALLLLLFLVPLASATTDLLNNTRMYWAHDDVNIRNASGTLYMIDRSVMQYDGAITFTPPTTGDPGIINESFTYTGSSYTTNGTVVTNIDPTYALLANVSVDSNESGGYYTNTSTNINTSSNHGASLYQIKITAVANYILTGANVYDFTATAPLQANTSTVPILYLNSGTYTLDFNKSGYFNTSTTVSCSYPCDTFATFDPVYDYIINITASDIINGSAINNFSVLFNSTTYSNVSLYNTTNGTLLVPWPGNDTGLSLTFATAGYANTTTSIDTNATTPAYINVSFTAYTDNSVNIRIYDEDNLTLVNFTTITITINGPTSQINTTSNGTIYIDDLPDGAYTFKFEGGSYVLRLYAVTVADQSTQSLDVYMSTSNLTTTFILTALNGPEAGQRVDGAIVSLERNINATYILVDSRYSDISGTAGPYAYTESARYRITITHDNYTTKQFILDPIIYSSYDVLLQALISYEDETDYAGTSITYTPHTFYDYNQNNFTFIISNPDGALTTYNYTLTYPGNTSSNSGTNAYGETLISNFNISGASFNSTILLTYCYDTTLDLSKCFNFTYTIQTNAGNWTWRHAAEANDGTGEVEKTLMAIAAIAILAGATAAIAGALGAGVIIIAGLAFFNMIGFINLWAALIPGLVGFFMIAKGATK